LLAKTLVTIPINDVVPRKILNPTDEVVCIPKGSMLSDFHLLNKDYDIIMDSDKTCKTQPVKVVNNVSSVQNSGQNKSDSSVFFDEFNISETLSLDQQEKLSDCLLQNRDIFVTKENPNLCYTTAVQHKIILKSDAKPKHQKPYRLPPHKREVLRHHLDELLRQGIIAPVSENEDVPITSPIVLVTKRAETIKSHLSDKDAALSQCRFVCDFRFLNLVERIVGKIFHLVRQAPNLA
jgi:hypothetical protein